MNPDELLRIAADLNPASFVPAAAHIVAGVVRSNWPTMVGAAVPVAGSAGFGARELRRHRRARLHAGARVVEIACPPESAAAGATALWSNLLGLHRPRLQRLLHGQPHVAFEYVFTRAGLALRMWVPGTVPPGMVERAIEAAWPGARALELPLPVSPLPPASPRDAVAGGQLVLARSEALPLATKHEVDPLRALIGAASGLATGQGACVQILARPADPRRARRARRRLRALEGKDAFELKTHAFNAVGPGRTHAGRASTALAMDGRLHADARAAAGKLAGSLWEVQMCYAATCPDTAERIRPYRGADPAATAIARGTAHALASATGAYAERNYLRSRRLTRPAELIGRRRMGRGQLYCVAELAALAHLPWDASVPGLPRAGARATAPSPTVPTGIRAGEEVCRVLGDADAGPHRPIALRVSDARQHLHVLGKTGSGKSTLLVNQALQDAEAGRAQVIVDPKGDLIEDILHRLPAAALSRPVVLFDPCDRRIAVPQVNMLAGADVELAVEHLVSIFSRIYTGSWGPRSDDLLRSACLTLVHAPRPDQAAPSLAQLPGLLGNSAVRRRILEALPERHEVLRGFWEDYETYSGHARAQVTGPLLNKLRAFLLRGYVAQVVAAGDDPLDLAVVLARGGLVLARLPKGVLGEDGSRLLGSFLVAKTWQAATTRAALRPQDRPDTALVLDEAHNFLNMPLGVEEMLAEARGYRLSLTLAHQDLAQLPTVMREAISANARNKIYFTASPEDSARLARHTAPHLSEHDLAHLGAYQAAARLVVDGTEQPACTLTTRPLPRAVPNRGAEVRALCSSAAGKRAAA